MTDELPSLRRRVPDELPDRCREGYFYEPTVITGLSMEADTNREEIFGPVVTIMPFDTEEEAVELANATAYGLSASVWTGSRGRADRMAAAIDAGTVWVNCWLLRDLRVPFGGIKHSGVGREGGEEAMHFFTEAKSGPLLHVRAPPRGQGGGERERVRGREEGGER